MATAREVERAIGRSTAPDRIALFGVLWAVAALLHLLAVGRQGPAWAQAAVAVAAGLAICWPGAVAPLAALAAAGVLAAWHESPGLTDQWALVVLVDVALLLAVAIGIARRRGADRIDLAERAFPAARLCFLGASAFAALAKLNDGFLDRQVSCAVLRFREATSSVGLEWLQLDGAAWLEDLVILGVLGTTLAVPVLLVLRRTRWLGVAVGVGFHVLVGLDRDQPFFDGAAAMVALVSLFLPTAGPWAAERVGSVRARLALRGPRLPLWARLALVLVPTSLGLLVAFDALDDDTARDVGWWAWQACAVVVVVAVARVLRQVGAGQRVRFLPYHPLYALVPVLVLLNGAAPYLELKTAASWASWSNLRIADGDTNHLLLPSTASVPGADGDVVRIVDTDDPALARLRARAVGLTWRDLRSYLADHPDTAIAYVRDGRRVALARAAERPELVEPVPTWREKLLPYRAVDLIEPERCLDAAAPGP